MRRLDEAPLTAIELAAWIAGILSILIVTYIQVL